MHRHHLVGPVAEAQSPYPIATIHRATPADRHACHPITCLPGRADGTGLAVSLGPLRAHSSLWLAGRLSPGGGVLGMEEAVLNLLLSS